MSKYIIIDAEAIQKRIEDLEKTTLVREKDIVEYEVLKYWLNQSTPLIPEIEKAYKAGKLDKELSLTFDNPKARYLNSLKLDI